MCFKGDAVTIFYISDFDTEWFLFEILTWWELPTKEMKVHQWMILTRIINVWSPQRKAFSQEKLP